MPAVFDREELAARLLEYLVEHYPDAVQQRFKITAADGENCFELLEAAGRKRGFLISRGEVDFERISRILLDEFRGGKLGVFTLEEPEDAE